MAKESIESDLKKTPSTSATETSSKSFYKKSSKRQESNTLPTKVLVRRLPPAMTKECFVEEVSPLPDHNYLWFVEADKSLGQYAFSRAYINFLHQEDIFIFTEKFDGYIFVDAKGDEYSAIVEFAPFQKIPKAARKKDAKNGTIETDPDFLKFLEHQENMLANKTPPTSTAETLEEITAKERELKANKGVLKMSTPLLDYLRKKKEDKIRIREEKKEERRKKDVDRRKQRDDERKNKQKDYKRPGEKPTKPDKPTKVLTGKHSVEKKVTEDELSSNLMTILKINETKEQIESTFVEKPIPKKSYKEGKAEPKEIKKREFKRKERKAPPASTSSAAVEEKEAKADFRHEKKAPPKPKPAHPPKEPKSYKEERQKIQEARAARAAAKLESKSGAGEKNEAAGGGEGSSSSKPTQRVRNKDRPALQIYRPGMLKRSTSDSKADDASEEPKGKADEKLDS